MNDFVGWRGAFGTKRIGRILAGVKRENARTIQVTGPHLREGLPFLLRWPTRGHRYSRKYRSGSACNKRIRSEERLSVARSRLGNRALLRKGSVSFIPPQLMAGHGRKCMDSITVKRAGDRTGTGNTLKTYYVETQRVHTPQAHGAQKTSRFRLRQLARTATYLHTLHQKRTHYVAHPPRARGTLGIHRVRDWHDGLIPAGAGNTGQRSSMNFLSWAHPRRRGEHRISIGFSSAVTGSSPHARGTQSHVLDHAARKRLIPACAGNTWWKLHH